MCSISRRIFSQRKNFMLADKIFLKKSKIRLNKTFLKQTLLVLKMVTSLTETYLRLKSHISVSGFIQNENHIRVLQYSHSCLPNTTKKKTNTNHYCLKHFVDDRRQNSLFVVQAQIGVNFGQLRRLRPVKRAQRNINCLHVFRRKFETNDKLRSY